jgi:aminomethyltransferase
VARGARRGQGAPAHGHRPRPSASFQAGILSWGQDIDYETVPFQCNLAYQVPRKKQGDYIGRAALERMRAEIAAGRPPFSMVMVGMKLGGKPIDDYAPDFWLVSDAAGGDPIGYLTSPWYAPELGCNIALGHVPVGLSAVGTELTVWLPDEYANAPGKPDRAQVCEVPFRQSANPSARELAHARGEDATV